MTLQLAILLILSGLSIGALVTWIITKSSLQSKWLSPNAIAEKYVLKEIHETVLQQNNDLKKDVKEKEEIVVMLNAQLAGQSQQVTHLNAQLGSQKEEMLSLQTQFKQEFENIAQRIFDEKSKQLNTQNQSQLQHILSPLREQLTKFEAGIEQKYILEGKERFSLKKEIEQLHTLNTQLASEAQNLTLALKGDSKTQGDWGEFQLETLLQKSGLTKDIHYRTQTSFTDNNGQQKRPDFIISLPDDKHLVIDAKVSLTAYERYFNADDETARQLYLKQHIDSLKQHIRDLGSKNYAHLYQINSPDYLLMFVPIESALILALKESTDLFGKALDKNIVMVSTSTLLATMRTVSYIWRQEKQKKNVLEIARQSGLLYDKFCGFVDDLVTIGSRIEDTQDAYGAAMNKLCDSKKYGDTLIGRAQKIKELGAKTTKQLPLAIDQ